MRLINVSRFLLLMLLVMGLTISACKKDEDEPKDNKNYSAFPDANTAALYTEAATAQAISSLEIAKGLVVKPAAPQDTIYYSGGWWIELGTVDYGGYNMDYDYRYQYKNNNVVQEEPTGADYLHSIFDLQGTYSGSQSGVTFNFVWHYFVDAELSNIDTDVYTINGDGFYDYTYESGQISYTYHTGYTYNNLQYPRNGCPTGELIVDLDPYVATVTFNGTTTASYSIKKGSVVEKTGTFQIFCN